MQQRTLWVGLGVLVIGGAALGATAVVVWDLGRVLAFALLVLVGVIVIASAFFARLELSNEGFREWRFVSGWTRWADVEDLRPERGYRGPDVVTFRYRPGTDPRPAVLRRLSRRGGVSARYGMNAFEQCLLMERLRRNAGATDRS